MEDAVRQRAEAFEVLGLQGLQGHGGHGFPIVALPDDSDVFHGCFHGVFPKKHAMDIEDMLIWSHLYWEDSGKHLWNIWENLGTWWWWSTTCFPVYPGKFMEYLQIKAINGPTHMATWNRRIILESPISWGLRPRPHKVVPPAASPSAGQVGWWQVGWAGCVFAKVLQAQLANQSPKIPEFHIIMFLIFGDVPEAGTVSSCFLHVTSLAPRPRQLKQQALQVGVGTDPSCIGVCFPNINCNNN